MNKFKSFMEKLKKHIFGYLIVWLIIAILFVVPLSYTVTESQYAGISWLQGMILNLFDNILKFPVTVIFEEKYIGGFIEIMKYYSILYAILVVVAINKTIPKSVFQDIEHGSSDWCKPGEQYKILSKKSGLILAKDNYLPVDKIGNINVLIVGRFRCW